MKITWDDLQNELERYRLHYRRSESFEYDWDDFKWEVKEGIVDIKDKSPEQLLKKYQEIKENPDWYFDNYVKTCQVYGYIQYDNDGEWIGIHSEKSLNYVLDRNWTEISIIDDQEIITVIKKGWISWNNLQNEVEKYRKHFRRPETPEYTWDHFQNDIKKEIVYIKDKSPEQLFETYQEIKENPDWMFENYIKPWSVFGRLNNGELFDIYGKKEFTRLMDTNWDKIFILDDNLKEFVLFEKRN